MLGARRRVARVLAVLLVAAGVAACGGGGTNSGNVVADVAGTPISRENLRHWMEATASGDFYEVGKFRAPGTLVSDPPNYGLCVARLGELTSRPLAGGIKPTSAQLRQKCEQLYPGLKLEALHQLITADVLVGEDAEHDITVTSAEVDHQFREFVAREFPKESELREYLANRGWTLSDELFMVKGDLLSSRLASKLKSQVRSEQALVRMVNEMSNKWTAKTSCSPGYVTVGCKQYSASQAPRGPSVAVLIEEISRWRGSVRHKPAKDVNCKNNAKGKLVCTEEP